MLLREFDFERFENKGSSSLFSIMEFQAFFDEHISRVTTDLVEKYNMIGD
jgi:hypothetical protein